MFAWLLIYISPVPFPLHFQCSSSGLLSDQRVKVSLTTTIQPSVHVPLSFIPCSLFFLSFPKTSNSLPHCPIPFHERRETLLSPNTNRVGRKTRLGSELTQTRAGQIVDELQMKQKRCPDNADWMRDGLKIYLWIVDNVVHYIFRESESSSISAEYLRSPYNSHNNNNVIK